MKRITKSPDIRRVEILETAAELFKALGYSHTTIEAIIQKIGIAKGTFYYYFKSKEDILDALVSSMIDQLCEEYKKIANNPKITVLNKVQQMLRGQNQISKNEGEIMEGLHLPDNRELHERINIEIINKIAPIFAQVIDQGKKEGVFNVENPLETVQFLLAGSQFLLESGLFKWNQDEQIKHILSMQNIIEKSLGAKPGSFSFI